MSVKVTSGCVKCGGAYVKVTIECVKGCSGWG